MNSATKSHREIKLSLLAIRTPLKTPGITTTRKYNLRGLSNKHKNNKQKNLKLLPEYQIVEKLPLLWCPLRKYSVIQQTAHAGPKKHTPT